PHPVIGELDRPRATTRQGEDGALDRGDLHGGRIIRGLGLAWLLVLCLVYRRRACPLTDTSAFRSRPSPPPAIASTACRARRASPKARWGFATCGPPVAAPRP